MARKIVGIRYISPNEQGKLEYKEDLDKEVYQTTDFTGEKIKRLLNKGWTFYQFLIEKEDGRTYWLDHSWFLERGFNDNASFHAILNSFDEVSFPPQRTIDVRGAYCVDAIQWDFKLKPIKIGVHETIPIPEEDKPDYLLRKEGIDYKQLNETALFTVNGFVHNSAYDADGIYIRQGYKTALQAKDINIGIINFEDISRLKVHAITENHWIKPVEDLSHLKAFYLTFENQDFTNKNLALVLGGYLHFVTKESKVVKRVGHNTLRIDAQEFHYYRRVKEIVKHLDGKNRLGMTTYHDERWNNREIESEDTLKAILNLSQTFLVEFTTPNQFIITKRLLHSANYPRRYFDTKRHYPLLRLADGRYPAYALRDDKNGFVVATAMNVKNHKFDDTAKTWLEPFVTDYNRTTFWPEVQEGEFVSIQAVTIVDNRKNNYEGQLVREQE